MLKFLTNFVSLSIISALIFPAFTHKSTINKAQSSIVHVLGERELGPALYGQYTCTGFMVDNHVAITAAHCEGDNVTMDGLKAAFIKDDKVNDLATYYVESSKGPVKFVKSQPTRFEQVYGIGYALGISAPTVTYNRVLFGDEVGVVQGGAGRAGLYVTGDYVPGMSGGPVVNWKGDVVGMIQQSNTGIGFGVTAKTILNFLGVYVR